MIIVTDVPCDLEHEKVLQATLKMLHEVEVTGEVPFSVIFGSRRTSRRTLSQGSLFPPTPATPTGGNVRFFHFVL